MSLENFDDLLAESRRQAEPQRLLLVFAQAELPPDATVDEREAFKRGEGGALAPSVCVDKLPEEIGTFAALIDEARSIGVHWDVIFVAAMGGRGGHAPNSDEAVQPLRMMVEQIKGGRIGRFLCVDRQGQLVQLQRAG
ncbi:ribonucleotide reductase subunit alpha [uncultured Aquimonas sp.]|jgi:hypothetical protein|uniref:ribonucleotide reductase subunit alpha n=1 Tax=uncultured Aquimonas sp. TaxID=385483 RepID=UPI00086B3698|nr:ribonucleotide reductase subunit alpha [uncultured Aquimonas sp.]ODU44475.1 MAG: ribonucleotide reductase subunit alpha [Xanthomonadaceae bacterium SCN 69-123]